jgi:hypothetical protein
MSTGAPDGVLMVQVAVTVDLVPVVPRPAKEAAAGKVGRYTGTATTYQTVASWTVATGKVGELKEILCLSDDYDHTYLQITVGAVVYATNWIATSALPIIFEDLKLEAATVVKVEAKSTDGTSIIVDAAIVGKEIG